MKITVDAKLLQKTVKQNNARYNAIKQTLRRSGMGEVITSKRSKLAHEKKSKRKKQKGKKVPHGRLIAWILKKQGNDPFEYPGQIRNESTSITENGIKKAIDKAFDTNQKQDGIIKQALLDSTSFLVNFAIERISSGKLGMNKKRTIERKKRAVKDGIATKEYGDPPPYGVLTGRFLHGIRNRWRQGRLEEDL